MILLLIPSHFEAAPFKQKLGAVKTKKYPSGLLIHTGKLLDKDVTLAIIGMGMPHAEIRTAETLQLIQNPTLVILAGTCGALSDTLAKNDLFATAVPNGLQVPWEQTGLYTSRELIAGLEHRRRLHAETGCTCVDMEQSFVKAKVDALNLPFLGLRIVSDTGKEEVPEEAFARVYNIASGRYTYGRLMAYLFTHPAEIKKLKAFTNSLKPTLQKLADELAGWLID